jgi:hypothetical protein
LRDQSSTSGWAWLGQASQGSPNSAAPQFHPPCDALESEHRQTGLDWLDTTPNIVRFPAVVRRYPASEQQTPTLGGSRLPRFSPAAFPYTRSRIVRAMRGWLHAQSLMRSALTVGSSATVAGRSHSFHGPGRRTRTDRPETLYCSLRSSMLSGTMSDGVSSPVFASRSAGAYLIGLARVEADPVSAVGRAAGRTAHRAGPEPTLSRRGRARGRGAVWDDASDLSRERFSPMTRTSYQFVSAIAHNSRRSRAVRKFLGTEPASRSMSAGRPRRYRPSLPL